MFSKINVLLIVLVLFSCRKVDGGNVKIIGHGGNGLKSITSVYESNTLKGFKYVLSFEDCSGVEMDIQLSKSGTLWCFHDETLSDITDGNSCINSLYDDQIEELRYNKGNEKLLKLADFPFDDYPTKYFFFDIRNFNYCSNESVNDSIMFDALESLNVNGFQADIYLKTSFIPWLNPLMAIGNKVMFVNPKGLGMESVLSNYPGIEGMDLKFGEDIEGAIELLKNENKVFCLYEIRAPQTFRAALKLGADFIETDDVKSAINIIN